MAGNKNLLTVSQVAERLSFNPYTVRDLLRRGELKGSKILSTWRVQESDLDDFVESRSNKG